nr:hypothetical protein [Tanacetum cinerariifolium]
MSQFKRAKTVSSWKLNGASQSRLKPLLGWVHAQVDIEGIIHLCAIVVLELIRQRIVYLNQLGMVLQYLFPLVTGGFGFVH